MINKDACDFSGLIADEKKIQDEVDSKGAADVAVYDKDYWKTDDYEMNKAVNQEKFRNLYNFDYDETKFDKETAADYE